MLMVILICILCGVWAWPKRKTSKNEPPAFPGALPLIGHAHLLIGDSAQLWNIVKQVAYESLKVDGVISAFIGPKTVYVVTDPEDFLTVANTCLQKDGVYDFAKPWFGEGLVTAPLSIWKVHRRLLNPTFSKVALDSYVEVFNKQSRRLVEDLEEEIGKGEFDHWRYTRHNALETICLTALGVDFTDRNVLNSQYENAAKQIFKVFIERFKKVWLHNNFIYSWSALKKKQDNYLKTLHNLSTTVLNKRKADYLMNRNSKTKEHMQGPNVKPLMDLLLELSIEKGAFNDREIREHVDTIIVGGHETSASVLMYSMLLVGSYPQVQDRIFEELNYVFGDDDRDVTKHDLSQLFYLEAVLKETMRLYPIIPVIVRYLDKDVKLRNCTLTKGRTCFMFVYGVHRHPMWGPDAEEFKPERWLDPATLPQCPTAFVGFSMGRRICIGKSYAYMSMKTTLAHFFRHYKVKGDHTKLKVKMDVLLKPVSGYHISIERRKKSI